MTAKLSTELCNLMYLHNSTQEIEFINSNVNKGVLVLITQSADHSIATRVALGTGETVPLPRRTVRVWRTVILFCIGAVLSRWASGDCLIIHVKW